MKTKAKLKKIISYSTTSTIRSSTVFTNLNTKMKKLTGRVTCSKGNDHVINENAIVTVDLVDCSIPCAPSKTLASIDLKARSFPFDFELEYDEQPILAKMGGYYSIQVRINTDGKLNYVTDTRFLLTDDMHYRLYDHIDMYVIPVVSYY